MLVRPSCRVRLFAPLCKILSAQGIIPKSLSHKGLGPKYRFQMTYGPFST